MTSEFVIGAYHRLFEIERSFRMSKHDLQARPIFHHVRESIEAHLAVVFAALAVTRWIKTQTDWSIKKFVRTARRYRTITIQAGEHTITAADPLPDDLHKPSAQSTTPKLCTKFEQSQVYLLNGGQPVRPEAGNWNREVVHELRHRRAGES